MCSQYVVSLRSEVIKEKFQDLKISQDFSINEKILPSKEAPCFVVSQQELKLVKMKFSMVPAWSQEPKVKFATHNARIETVEQKPTWKSVFLNQHCVIPMAGFFESVYTGPKAGHVIQFKDVAEQPLYAAGVFDFWKNDPDPNKHFFSFSILTEEPTSFIVENGHDRSPIFLNEKFVKEWCALKSMNSAETKQNLAQWSYKPELKVEIERPLKPGWEKRI